MSRSGAGLGRRAKRKPAMANTTYKVFGSRNLKSFSAFRGFHQNRKIRLFTASLFTHAKEKASKASAKPAGMEVGVGVRIARKASKKNREVVDIIRKEWTYRLCYRLITYSYTP